MIKIESINDPKVRKKYAGQYIVRRGSTVLVHDKRGDRLFDKLDKKGIDPTKVVIDYVRPLDTFFSLHVR